MQYDDYQDIYQDTNYYDIREEDFVGQIHDIVSPPGRNSYMDLYSNGEIVGFIIKAADGTYSCYETIRGIDVLSITTKKVSEVATEVYLNWSYSWK